MENSKEELLKCFNLDLSTKRPWEEQFIQIKSLSIYYAFYHANQFLKCNSLKTLSDNCANQVNKRSIHDCLIKIANEICSTIRVSFDISYDFNLEKRSNKSNCVVSLCDLELELYKKASHLVR